MAAATVAASVGGSMTRPGHAVEHRVGRATRLARDLRHAARGRFEEDDAEALLFETAPAAAAHVAEHVGRAVQRDDLVLRHAAEEADRRAHSGGERAQPLLVAARAGDEADELRAASCASCATARIIVSAPLRGTSRLRCNTTSASSAKAERLRGSRRVAPGVLGTKA